MRVLLCEDERPLSRAIALLLEKSNYLVDTVYNGDDAISYLECSTYDALILDIMIPGKDGFAVLEIMRSRGDKTPVLVLSALSEVEHKVRCLDSGANYYLTKPFETRELLAALRAITRQYDVSDSRLSYGNVVLDRATFELSTPTGKFRLARREFQMIEMLMSNPRRIISTELMLEKIWGYETDVDQGVVWVYLSFLRKKLTAIDANIRIRASRNAGYCLEALDDSKT